MKPFAQWTMSLQLLTSLCLVVSAIFFLSIYLNYNMTEQRIKFESKLHANQTLISIRADIKKVLNEVKSSTSTLAVVAQHGRYSENKLSDLLKNIVINNRHVYGASIALEPEYTDSKKGFAPYFYRPKPLLNAQQTGVDSTGQADAKNQMILYSNLNRKDYAYNQQDWYVYAKSQSKPVWSSPYLDDGGGDIYMTSYSVPIVTTEGFYGVVTGDLDLESISDKVQAVKFSEHAYTLLLDHTMSIVSSPDIKNYRQPIDQALGDLIDQPVWQEAMLSMQNGEAGMERLPCPLQSGHCLVAYLPLAIKNTWPLLLIFPEDELFAELHTFTIRYASIALVLIIFYVSLVSFLVSRLTRPMYALAKASEEIGRGDLSLQLPNIHASAETSMLIQAFEKMQVALKGYINRLKNETAAINQLHGEMQAATQIQMEMLPGNGLAVINQPDISLWAHVLPAKSVGGDLYHFRLQQHRLLFIVGDVSDKGVPAALFMANTISLFKQFSQQQLSPAVIMSLLNEALVEGNDACMFVTACVGELNVLTGELSFSSAGHAPPWLVNNQQCIELSQDTGPALGLIEAASYPTNRSVISAKDKIVIYTDGIDEAFNTDQQMFGIQGLYHQLLSTQTATVTSLGEALFSAVQSFSAGQPQSDDMTVMVLEYKPQFQFLINSPAYACEVEHLSVNACNSAMQDILQTLQAYLAKQGIAHYNLCSVQMVIEEAFVNAINHGSLVLDTVDFYFTAFDQHIMVEMIDSGIAYNPFKESPVPELGLPIEDTDVGGLGVHLIRSMSKQYRYKRSNDKNHLCLLIKCDTDD